jgi:drug/metabolite transporter (DMT)-like permease
VIESDDDLLAVAASVCFALYLLVTERLRGTFDALFLTTISASASAVALIAFALIAGIPLSVPSVSAAVSVIGLGLVCQIGGYFCLTYALGHLPATMSSVILLAVAPLTALLAFLLFGEQMKLIQLVGGVLILAAVLVASREKRPVLITANAQQTPV